MGGRSGAIIMILVKGGRGIRRGRAGKMATAVAVLRGVPAIHGTSRVATHRVGWQPFLELVGFSVLLNYTSESR